MDTWNSDQFLHKWKCWKRPEALSKHTESTFPDNREHFSKFQLEQVLAHTSPCHSSGGQLPASHRTERGSNTGQSMWDLGQKKRHWDRNLFEDFSWSLPIATLILIYISSFISRRMGLSGHVARMGDRRGAYRALVGKPEGKWPLVRPRRIWEDNINTDLQEVEWRSRTGLAFLRTGIAGGLL